MHDGGRAVRITCALWSCFVSLHAGSQVIVNPAVRVMHMY